MKENLEKSKIEDLRKALTDLLGEENIGFWHLIDQIIFFEGLLPQFLIKNH